jgi:hypothetical protein
MYLKFFYEEKFIGFLQFVKFWRQVRNVAGFPIHYHKSKHMELSIKKR